MNKFILNKKNGDIVFNDLKIDGNFTFKNFCDYFIVNANLLQGENGNGKYILKQEMEITKNKFTLCFYFKNSKLSAIQFYLLSGIIKYEANTYPSDQELIDEFNLLNNLLYFNFGPPSRSPNPDTIVWQFENSILSLQLQNHDQSVYFILSFENPGENR